MNTRLQKLELGKDYDAIVLAYAGVHRLNWTHKISQILDPDVMLHAVGQGALGIECRTDNQQVLEMLATLNDKETSVRCIAERQFMKLLEGGCSVPLGVFTEIKGNRLSFKGSVTSLDGKTELICLEEIELVKWEDDAKELGGRVARNLKSQGADVILKSIRSS